MKANIDLIDLVKNHIKDVEIKNGHLGDELIIHFDNGLNLNIADGEFGDLSCIVLKDEDMIRIGNLAHKDIDYKGGD